MGRRRDILLGLALAILAVPAAARAQADIPLVEITVFPGGTIVFQDESDEAPGFNNFSTFGTVTLNLNAFFALEGEVGGLFAFDQDLDFASGTVTGQPPSFAIYNMSVAVNLAPRHWSAVPYVVGGGGGMTLFSRPELGVDDATGFIALHVGTGARFTITERWGLRADYRYMVAVSDDAAPMFFGLENRFGHRLAAGILFTLGR